MSNHWINGSEWGMKADESMLTISADQLHLSERLLYRHLENEVKFTPTTPAQQGPEWAPILSWRGRSGRWGISKWRISSNILNAILAIWEQNSLSDNNVCLPVTSRACRGPLLTGRPDTAMYASPIVSICIIFISFCLNLSNFWDAEASLGQKFQSGPRRGQQVLSTKYFLRTVQFRQKIGRGVLSQCTQHTHLLSCASLLTCNEHLC